MDPSDSAQGAPAVPPGIALATLCCGLLASLPFLVPIHGLPIPSFQSEWLAAALGLFAVLLLAWSTRAGAWLVPGVALAPLALALVVLVQLATGSFAYASSAVTIILYLLWCAVLAIAGSTLARALGSERLCTRLAWFMLAGGLLNASFGMLQYLQVAGEFGALISEPMQVSQYGIYGNLAQQNHFATHMALAIVAAGYLGFKRRLMLAWFCTSCLLLLAALVLSGSRSSFLYLGWTIVVAVSLVRRDGTRTVHRHASWWALAAFAFAVAALLLVARAFPTIAPIERLQNMSAAFGPRLYLWKHALLMFRAHPLLGVGFDSFAFTLVEQLGQSKDALVWGIDQYAHNLALQLLAVSGLSGLLAVGMPGVLFLRRQWRAPCTLERMWVWGVLGVLLIHSMFEQPLYYTYFLGVFALVAGTADWQVWRLLPGRAAQTLALITLAAGLVVLGKSANDYDNIEGMFYSGRYANPDPARQLAARAQLAHALDATSIFAPLAELVAPADFVPADAPPADKLKFNQRVMRYAPIAETEFRHAALLAEDGQATQAAQQFRQAAYAYPDEADSYLLRFDALATGDPAHYGSLAAYANTLMPEVRSRRRFAAPIPSH